MKHILLFLSIFLFSLIANAQVPDSFTYQLVVRDAGGKAVKNDTVSVEVSIVSDSAMGQSQYSEVHSATTTVSGLVTLVIGTGLNQTGNLAAIDWESRPYYLKIRIDTEGGTNYGSAMSMEMVSVPYALYSGQADTALDASYADTLAVSVSKEGDTLYLGTSGKYVVIPGLSEANPSSGCLQGATEVVEVTSTTGRVWMDRNLGAFQAATSSTDSLAYGDYYQWGRGADGHQCRESDTVTVLASTAETAPDSLWYEKFIVSTEEPKNWLSKYENELWQGENGTNNPCPSGFRIPTELEWAVEEQAWGDSPNADSAFASPLKIPMSGYRNGTNGSPVSLGEAGFYWSSSIRDTSGARAIQITSNNTTKTTYKRSIGYSVRCIKHITPTPVTGCENDTTEVVEVTATTGRVWMDRNLGATRAALTVDDPQAYGALYQWGRSADGHQCRNSETTYTLASTATSSPDSAWHGKFITKDNWLITFDSTLWVGVNAVNNPCPTGFRLPTSKELLTEVQSWEDDDPFSSPLKWTVSGIRNSNSGDVFGSGSRGRYWSGDVRSGYEQLDYREIRLDDGIGSSVGGGAGHGVRCIKEQEE